MTDVNILVDNLDALTKETGIDIPVIKDKKVRQAWFESLVKRQDIIYRQTEHAVILGVLSPFWFNPEIISATVLTWWADKEKAKHWEALKLLKEFEAEAERRGADYVVLVEPNIQARSQKLLQRLGFEQTEQVYMRKV